VAAAEGVAVAVEAGAVEAGAVEAAGKALLTPCSTRALPEPLASWVYDFIAKGDQRLGRPGAVCPALPDLLERDGLFWARKDLALALRGGAPPVDAVAGEINGCLDAAAELIDSRSGQITAALWLLDGLPPHTLRAVVDVAFERCRTRSVELGLMMGLFHRYRQRPSLVMPGVRTMCAPHPALAIRPLLKTDDRSLRGEPDALAAFWRRFAVTKPPRKGRPVGGAEINTAVLKGEHS
jgi:hypothetical protein